MAKLFWTQKQDIGPSARSNAAIAYDSARQRVVLFGGQSGSPLNDTWAWDGTLWTQVEDIGPPARSAHSLAFDSVRQRVVLFGGLSGSTVLGDTWEWDGTEWTQMADTGPSARLGLEVTFDSKIQRVVLFGGMDQNSKPFADTWIWDGNDWTQVQDVGPSARINPGLAYDSVRDRVVLFGGSEVKTAPPAGYATPVFFPPLDDTWEWDANQWTRAADTGPAPRGGHGMVYDGTNVLLFGGQNTSALGFPGALTEYFADTWQWDGKHWTQLQDIGPAPRLPAGMTFDSARNRSVLFGGSNQTGNLGDTWELYDPNAKVGGG